MNAMYSSLVNSSPGIQLEQKETRIYPLNLQQAPNKGFLNENTVSLNGIASCSTRNETSFKSNVTSDEEKSNNGFQEHSNSFDQTGKNPRSLLTVATMYMGKILFEVNCIETRLKDIHELVENHLKDAPANNIQSQILESEERMQRILQKTELELELKFEAISRQVTHQLSQIYFVLSEWISMMSCKNRSDLTVQNPINGQISIAPQQQSNVTKIRGNHVQRKDKQSDVLQA